MAKMADNVGVLTPDDFRVAVALGHHSGWRNLRKFGRNDDIDGNEELWEYGTSRVLPTTAAVLDVSSSSTADDADPAGTGAWTITVEGLDGNYDEVSETITMNGTTSVNSTQTFLRVNRAYVLTAGSAESNVGNIDILVGGNEQAYIEADEGQTHQTHYTVPAGHTLVITSFSLACGRLGGSNDIVIESQIKSPEANYAWRTISAIDLTSGEVYLDEDIAVVLPEKWDIRQRTIFSGTNSEVGGEFHGYLIDNDYIGS